MGANQSLPIGSIAIEADQRYSTAAVQVCHLDLTKTEERILHRPDAFRVDLCLTPRLPARMRFERWKSNRFERPGRIFVVPPGESLAVWNDLGRESVIVAYLFTDAMAQIDEAITQRGDPLDKSIAIASPSIEHLMLRLRSEVRDPGFASEIMVEGIALQLGVELQRHYGTAPQAVTGGLSPVRLRRIEDRLEQSLEPPSLIELAQLCDLSVRQLSRGFRESRGQSIGQYVARHRIERAKDALVRDPSIKSIASRLGFSSTAAFSAAFRKATGVAPSQFRRACV